MVTSRWGRICALVLFALSMYQHIILKDVIEAIWSMTAACFVMLWNPCIPRDDK